jgi:hypothetical protein
MRYSEQFERALISLDFDWGVTVPTLHCPVTCEPLLWGSEDEDKDLPDWEGIPTVRFVYCSESGGAFEYIHPDLQAAIDVRRAEMLAAATTEDEKDDIDYQNDFEILSEQYIEALGEQLLVFEVVTRGMACGPVAETVFVGLDLSLG